MSMKFMREAYFVWMTCNQLTHVVTRQLLGSSKIINFS